MKKTKPATAGEKLVQWFWGDMMNLADIRNPHTPCEENAREFARRIDAAIRRAVRKERERCAKILRKYTTNDTVCWLLTQHFKSECEP